MAGTDTSPWPSILTVINIVIGFALGLFGDKAKSFMFKAAPKCRFGNGIDLIGITSKDSEKYLYLRGAVTNSSRTSAKNLNVFLVKIEKEESPNKFTRIDYNDYLQLRWSAVPETSRDTGRDIPCGVSACFDLIHTKSINPDKIELCATFFPKRYAQLFEEPTRYRFTVCIVCENANPRNVEVVINWGSRWDKISVVSFEQVSTSSRNGAR
jgi:hypothetical protein